MMHEVSTLKCKMSMLLQSGPILRYVRNVIEVLQERGDPVQPGDVIMHNDP
ncbi:MAG: N-methylhydantoinase B [Octadecabacter sp.]|jgi:N-methylhydantoinase B